MTITTHPFDHVVVPLDGSPFSERAVPFALAFAERLGAATDLIGIAGDHGVDERLRTQLEQLARQAVATLFKTASCSVRPQDFASGMAFHAAGATVDGAHVADAIADWAANIPNRSLCSLATAVACPRKEWGVS
jgi:hypothetical protein